MGGRDRCYIFYCSRTVDILTANNNDLKLVET